MSIFSKWYPHTEWKMAGFFKIPPWESEWDRCQDENGAKIGKNGSPEKKSQWGSRTQRKTGCFNVKILQILLTRLGLLNYHLKSTFIIVIYESDFHPVMSTDHTSISSQKKCRQYFSQWFSSPSSSTDIFSLTLSNCFLLCQFIFFLHLMRWCRSMLPFLSPADLKGISN